MKRFSIQSESYTSGFHEHVTLDLRSPVVEQLRRKRLQFRMSGLQGEIAALKGIIQRNSSLRVSFGWSFERSDHYETIMAECLDIVAPKYNVGINQMISDLRCSWLGFVPFNIFEKPIYEDLSPASMILFNNELIDFQTDVVKFIAEHRIFRQHSILRSDSYRFDTFKECRKDPDALEDLYRYYIQAMQDISLVNGIPRDYLEEQIGCHFLYHPELFFELLEFSILKGEVHE